MSDAMFGRVIVPYMVDDERKEVEIEFVPGSEFWDMIVEHDATNDTNLFDEITVGSIIKDEIEYDVSSYRVTTERDGEYIDQYFMTEEEAYMYMLGEWEDMSHTVRSKYGVSWDMTGLEVDYLDEDRSGSDTWYMTMSDVLWSENMLVDMWEHMRAGFIARMEKEENPEMRMKAFYNIDRQKYEMIMNDDDESCVFTQYYEIVRSWAEEL